MRRRALAWRQPALASPFSDLLVTEDELDDGSDKVDGFVRFIIAVLCWLLIPYVTGRVVEANVSVAAGNFARPAVLILMLAYSLYRPGQSRFRMALLSAVDVVLLLSLVVYCSRFAMVVFMAGFKFKAMPPVAWSSLAAAIGFVLLRSAIKRWIRFTA